MANNGLDVRVKKLISEFGLNKTTFAKRCGFEEHQTRQIMKGVDIGVTKAVMIINAFPEVNPLWILKGEEPIYNSKRYTNESSTSYANEKEFCTECYIKEGQLKQLEVFNESLIRRNDKLSEEIGRLKGIIENLKGNQNQKNTG